MRVNMKQCGIILTVLLALTTGGAAFAVEKTCEFCHSDHKGGGVLLKKDINELCSGCHQKRISQGEHKVGVMPSKSAAGIPLQNGKMTCVSCHDPHSKAPGMPRMATRKLCGLCHEK